MKSKYFGLFLWILGTSDNTRRCSRRQTGFNLPKIVVETRHGCFRHRMRLGRVCEMDLEPAINTRANILLFSMSNSNQRLRPNNATAVAVSKAHAMQPPVNTRENRHPKLATIRGSNTGFTERFARKFAI